MSQTKQLSDTDTFPFGKHKGKRMQDVPSSYLDWLAGQPWIKDWPAVESYIQRSRKAIDQDLKRSGKI